jgi:DNA invertase Pin-like site-specific DNA recombinase
VNAVGYIRVSTGRQAREGVSLEAQERDIRAWAIAAHAETVRIFSDKGKSGRGVNNRPGLRAALAAVGRGDALVCYSLSRLARSIVHAGEIAALLKRRGTQLVLLSEAIDTRGATGELIFNIMASFAQFESSMIGERVASAWTVKRSRREKTGGSPPFGYFVRHGRLIPKASEYPAVQDILRRRRRGESLQRIASALERQGVRRKEGGSTWYPVAVARVLRAESMRNACSQAL